MNIVVVGDGKVGYTLTASLSKEGHDVTVIDNRPDTLRNTTNELDVICIEGNGVSYAVQSEAGVQKADLLIACMVAKKLGAKHTIARVRDPQYQQQMFFLKEELGLSVVVNPEQSAASEISRLMRFVPAIKAEPFAKGRIDLVEFKVKENSPLDGVQLSDFYRQFKVKILVCAARRGEEVFIPKGNFIIRSGDKLTILAAPAEISSFFRTVGTFQRKVRDVMVVGGGRIAYYLARQLIETGIHVKIIEKDEKRCNQLFDLLPKATILHGDGTDHELLSEEGLDKTDALIALTGIDEENIILSMYANSLNVDKVVTKVNNARLAEMLAPMGIESVISPKEIAANRIISYVRAMTNATGSNVEMLYRLADNKVEALEFRVRESSRCIGVPLKDMPIKDDVLVGAIIRGGTCIIPGGDDVIKAHDSVIVVTTMNGLHELDNILKEKE